MTQRTLCANDVAPCMDLNNVQHIEKSVTNVKEKNHYAKSLGSSRSTLNIFYNREDLLHFGRTCHIPITSAFQHSHGIPLGIDQTRP